MDFREGRMVLMPQKISRLDTLKKGQNPLGGGFLWANSIHSYL